MSQNVYVQSGNYQTYVDLLVEKQLPGLHLTTDKNNATILLADPPLVAASIDEFPQLKWLQSTFAGVDSLMANGLRRDYQLTNIKGIFGPLIAEYVLGYLLSYQRHFSSYKQQQNQAQWSPREYRSLVGLRMVILGTGVIGAYLANVAQSFGIHVTGINSSGNHPQGSSFDAIVRRADMGSVLNTADILVCTLPGTPETRHILNQKSLAPCDSILLFNVGRGINLDETALIPAIEAGHVAHAFLDVFQNEPLVSSHPFWQHNAITVTPHIAAVSFPHQVVDIFAENYMRWIQGEDLTFKVDFTKGY